MRKVLLFVLGLLVLFIGYILVNTLSFKSEQLVVDPVDSVPVSENAVSHLSEAIRIRTVSTQNKEDFDSAQFYQFKEFISRTYPFTETLFEKKIFGEFSLLFKWPAPSSKLKPVILLAHLDVVPVEEESLDQWQVPPFEGRVQEGAIWGRGAIDDKLSLIALLEAASMLIQEGYQPERPVYFAFGHDEEVGGTGAKAMAAYLKAQGVQAEFVLDEGLAITQRMVPGLEQDVALIGLGEKGYSSVKLSVSMEGGHSSMPSRENAISTLSRALTRLQENPFPARFTPIQEKFMASLGPEMPFLQRMAFANGWLFKPMIVNIYEATPSGNALMRTTTALTVIKSGLKENVIPTTAVALVNFRILPGETSADVVQYVKEVIDDPRVEVDLLKEMVNEPSPVSSTESIGYQVLNKTIKQLYPNTLTAPGLVLAATDSRHYTEVSDQIFRFQPVHINPDNVSSIHGVNEKVLITDYENAVRFYRQLLINLNEE